MPAIIRSRGERVPNGVTFQAINELQAFCILLQNLGYWTKHRVSAKDSKAGFITLRIWCNRQIGQTYGECKLRSKHVDQREWLQIIDTLNAQNMVMSIIAEPIDVDRMMGIISDGALN